MWLLCVSQALWFHMPQVSSLEVYSQDFWFLEDPRQLFTCHLQNPPVCFAGRVTLVKDSFRGLDNRCQHVPLVQPDSTGQMLEKKKSNFYFYYFYFFSQLNAVTLALPVVKASLTGLHILIMPNIIFTIALTSRQGLIISSDSIGRQSAEWGPIDLSGRAVQLEAN